jgi:hypothetical protein
MITNDELYQLIEYLTGSCITISEAMNDLFEKDEDCLTEEQEDKLNQEIFNCSECGWWYEYSEESGLYPSDLICLDCAEE